MPPRHALFRGRQTTTSRKCSVDSKSDDSRPTGRDGGAEGDTTCPAARLSSVPPLELAHGRGVMTRLLAGGLAFGLSAAPADDKAGKDEWRGSPAPGRALYVRDGKEVPKAEAEKIRLVVAGEKYTLNEGGETIEGTHSWTPPRRPRASTRSGPRARTRGRRSAPLPTQRDSFVACFAAPGKDRPAEPSWRAVPACGCSRSSGRRSKSPGEAKAMRRRMMGSGSRPARSTPRSPRPTPGWWIAPNTRGVRP